MNQCLDFAIILQKIKCLKECLKKSKMSKLKPIFTPESEQGQDRLLSCSNMIIVLQHLTNEQLALIKDVELKQNAKQLLNNQFSQTTRLIKLIENVLSKRSKEKGIDFVDVFDNIVMFYSYCFQELNKIKDPEKMVEVIALLKEFNNESK